MKQLVCSVILLLSSYSSIAQITLLKDINEGYVSSDPFAQSFIVNGSLYFTAKERITIDGHNYISDIIVKTDDEKNTQTVVNSRFLDPPIRFFPLHDSKQYLCSIAAFGDYLYFVVSDGQNGLNSEKAYKYHTLTDTIEEFIDSEVSFFKIVGSKLYYNVFHQNSYKIGILDLSDNRTFAEFPSNFRSPTDFGRIAKHTFQFQDELYFFHQTHYKGYQVFKIDKNTDAFVPTDQLQQNIFYYVNSTVNSPVKVSETDSLIYTYSRDNPHTFLLNSYNPVTNNLTFIDTVVNNGNYTRAVFSEPFEIVSDGLVYTTTEEDSTFVRYYDISQKQIYAMGFLKNVYYSYVGQPFKIVSKDQHIYITSQQGIFYFNTDTPTINMELLTDSCTHAYSLVTGNDIYFLSGYNAYPFDPAKVGERIIRVDTNFPKDMRVLNYTFDPYKPGNFTGIVEYNDALYFCYEKSGGSVRGEPYYFQLPTCGEIITSSASGNFANSLNWDCGSVPTSINQAVIKQGHSIQVDENSRIILKSILVEDGAVLDITKGAVVEINPF